MSNILWKSLLVSPAVLGATLVVSATAIAAPTTTNAEVTQSEVSQTATPEEKVADNANDSALQLAATPETSSTPAFSTSAGAFEFGEPKLGISENDAELKASVKEQPVVQTPEKLAQVNVPPGQNNPAATSTTPVNTLDQVNRYSAEGRGSNSLSQVTSVSQFSDVEPTDWAFQALQALVERYGCIAGYPDGTYRGNRALTRYEFAAGVYACLERINELIATATADLVTKEDLVVIQRLQEEFAAELATLRGRVDALEARTAELEANQFSTTTRLVGEAIFAVTDVFGDDAIEDLLEDDAVENNVGEDINTVFGYRARLEFQTSFTGQDILHTRLASSNLERFRLGGGTLVEDGIPLNTGGTFEATQTFNLGPEDGVAVDWLAYEFNFGPSKVYLAATGGLHADYVPVLNPYFYDGDGGNGSLSTFAQQSPIYRIGGGAGIGVRLGVGRAPILGPTSLTLGYLADNANNPNEDFGFLNGDYAALAQLNFTVNDRISLGATYVHGYHNAGNPIFDGGSTQRTETGLVGSFFANNPGSLQALATGDTTNFPVVTNTYGAQAAFRLGDRISISGFVSYTDAEIIGPGSGEIWSYGLGVAFPDLGKEGNLLGIFAGAQPYLGSLEETAVGNVSFGDRPYHIEAFYKYQLTNNISITPGVIWLTSPNQNNNNDDAFIGTLRTTFNF